MFRLVSCICRLKINCRASLLYFYTAGNSPGKLFHHFNEVCKKTNRPIGIKSIIIHFCHSGLCVHLPPLFLPKPEGPQPYSGLTCTSDFNKLKNMSIQLPVRWLLHLCNTHTWIGRPASYSSFCVDR